MKRWGFIAVLALGLVMAATQFALADLVNSPDQVINLHGKTDSDGIVASFNLVQPDGSGEVPFTFPENKILMVTRVEARCIIPGKGATLYRLRIFPSNNTEKPFFTFGVQTIYDSKSKNTFGGIQGENINPGVPMGTAFTAKLYDFEEKNVVPAFLRVRLIGYLVDAP